MRRRRCRLRPHSCGLISLSMSSPLAQRRKEIVDVLFFGPKIAEQFSRVRSRNRALRQFQFLDRGMSRRCELLLDCLCHQPSLTSVRDFADERTSHADPCELQKMVAITRHSAIAEASRPSPDWGDPQAGLEPDTNGLADLANSDTNG